MRLVTGELIQECADVYIGTLEDFAYNPYISQQTGKHLQINVLYSMISYANPPIIFCYSSLIKQLSAVAHIFENQFTLITHNGDANVEDVYYVNSILNTPNLKRWYAQNVNYSHDKLVPLPIGIANRMWPHGNVSIIESSKTCDVYMSFDLNTNPKKRSECFEALRDKVPFLPFVSPNDNIERLAQYKYCVCPEGNGLDTHRLWEALYLQVVPIMLKTKHVELLTNQYLFPVILLDRWQDLDVSSLPPYEIFKFHHIDMDKLRKQMCE
jgi:hypothetical protein